mmetsp:Transcript_33444/g.83383  ORF Transcript_33444/g.83383 Transcript_33444/m.83383 type:complete len:210 (-) Transcript_33444:904-1533(-)
MEKDSSFVACTILPSADFAAANAPSGSWSTGMGSSSSCPGGPAGLAARWEGPASFSSANAANSSSCSGSSSLLAAAFPFLADEPGVPRFFARFSLSLVLGLAGTCLWPPSSSSSPCSSSPFPLPPALGMSLKSAPCRMEIAERTSSSSTCARKWSFAKAVARRIMVSSERGVTGKHPSVSTDRWRRLAYSVAISSRASSLSVGATRSLA